MSTLAEIEQAIASLPMPQQRELYLHLGAQFGRGATPAKADKRTEVDRFLRRWTGAGTAVTEEELRALRTARLLEKQVK